MTYTDTPVVWCPSCGTIKTDGKYCHPCNPRDEYHTMQEIYDYRMAYNALAARALGNKAWRSMLHSDGTMWPDYFVVGIRTEQGDATNHYKMDHWSLFDGVPTLDQAPEYDGHTPRGGLSRLLGLLREM